MQNPYSLAGKRILVTGASTGIGRSIAIWCANQQANVILTARNKPALEDTHQLLPNDGHSIITADLSKENDLIALASQLPVLDGIVMNAGMVKTQPVQFIKKAVMDEMFLVNFQASVLLIQQLLKMKKISKGGSICFISSVSSNYVQLGNSVYSATKGAVNSFAKGLALELAPKQIRVNAILPGLIETNILQNSTIGEDHLVEHKKNYPLGRYGKPDDVAHLVVYLLSDASSWMTGSLLTIDGGYSIK